MPENVLHLLHRARQLAHADFASLGGEMAIGLTPTQFLVLRTIAMHPGASQTVVGNATGTDRSTMADVVRRLMNSRHIRRRQHEADSRANVIHLTDKGQEALHIAEKVANQLDGRLRKALGRKEYEQLSQSLQSLIGELKPCQRDGTVSAGDCFSPT